MSLIALFTDHSSPVAAKRALLASAFVTITLSLVEVEGTGLTILGLTFVAKSEGILNVSKAVLTYLILVYLGFLIHDFLGWLKGKGLERNVAHQNSLKRQALDRYYDIIGEPDPEVDYPTSPHEERDLAFDDADTVRATADQFVEKKHKIQTEFVTYFFQVLLALLIALYALIAPKEITRSLLLTENSSESEVVTSEVGSDPGPSSGVPEVDGSAQADNE